jgi:VWFA-related protein
MRSVLTVAILAVSLIVSVRILGQESLRLSVDVSLVTVDVEVTDSSDRLVTTLTKDDFQVFEDGTQQELRSFDSVDTPYNILLLFDCSPSTEPNWPFLLQAMNRFTQTLRLQDRVAIGQFGGGFKILQKWFAASSSSLEVKVQTRDPVCSGTDFYAAVLRSVEELRTQKGRKGAVILSDGVHVGIPFQRGNNGGASSRARYVDSVDDAGFQKVVRGISESSAVLYFVAVDTDLNPGAVRTGEGSGGGTFNPEEIYNRQQIRARLERLAARTGGRVVFPHKPDEVVGLFEQIGRELGKSYSLGYVPANPQRNGAFRKIEVRVRDRALHVRQSREGYEAR